MKVGQLLLSESEVAYVLKVLGCHALCQSHVRARHSWTGLTPCQGYQLLTAVLIASHQHKSLLVHDVPRFDVEVCIAILFNLLQPGGYYLYHQFNIQQFYVLSTLYLCVLFGSENKQRLFPYTALTDWFL